MTRLQRHLLVAGIALGVLGDLLFQDAGGLGLNVPLWLTAVAVAGWAVTRDPGRGRVPPALLALVLFLALALTWRASPFLRSWNVVAILAAGVVISAAIRGRLGAAWPEDYARGAAALAGRIISGAPLAAAGARASGSEPATTRRITAVAVGTVLAVPVFFVFGSLLASADPVFEGFVDNAFAWLEGQAMEHVLLTLVLAWVAVGWLRMVAMGEPAGHHGPLQAPIRLGLPEITIPLATLTVLLALFLGIQARYVLDGDMLVRTTGLTYAEVAREGFFQLVVVTMLVVPLLMVGQRLLDRSAPRADERFRALAVVVVLLVGLVMVAALARMRLYVEAYGLTEDRFYATAFMFWIAAVLAWFVITEIRAARERFTTGAVMAGFALLAVLNAVNPEARIASTNLARADQGLPFDAEYAASLSADAAPVLAAAWERLDGEARCVLGAGVLKAADAPQDWRAWTWARHTAARSAAGLSRDPCPDPAGSP